MQAQREGGDRRQAFREPRASGDASCGTSSCRYATARQNTLELRALTQWLLEAEQAGVVFTRRRNDARALSPACRLRSSPSGVRGPCLLRREPSTGRLGWQESGTQPVRPCASHRIERQGWQAPAPASSRDFEVHCSI